MAMNSREKLLAAGIGVIATLFVGNSVVSSVRSGFDKKRDLVQTLEKKKSDQELQMTAGKVASLKLNKVVAKSLPRNEELAIGDYQKWLIELGEEAKLAAPTSQNTGDSIEKDGSYHLYKFKLAGTGTIENATQLLYGFYSKDYLHRIVQFEFRPVPNSAEPDQLIISLNCEVLALGVAKDKQEPPKNSSGAHDERHDVWRNDDGHGRFGPSDDACADGGDHRHTLLVHLQQGGLFEMVELADGDTARQHRLALLPGLLDLAAGRRPQQRQRLVSRWPTRLSDRN